MPKHRLSGKAGCETSIAIGAKQRTVRHEQEPGRTRGHNSLAGSLLASKRSEGGRLREVCREILDVYPHRRVPEVFEVEEEHLMKGFFCGPMLEDDAIRRQEYAGAVVA